jgi:hypothetical protein
MSREYGYGQGQAQEPMVWERVEWRQGDGRYVFEVAQGGLHATLSSPHGTKLTLPMVAWEGLLDALAAARKTKSRAESNLPSRMGARWSQVETQELAKTFKAGGSIAQLARVHNRTQFAVEAQLDRQGLWDRVERRPTARAVGGHLPKDESRRPSGPMDAASPRTPAPAEGRPPDSGQQPPSGAMDAAQPPTSAPVADRRHDAARRSPYGPIDRPWSPDAAPAAGRRSGPGQQPLSEATDTHGPPTFAPASGVRGADRAPDFAGSKATSAAGASAAIPFGADRD